MKFGDFDIHIVSGGGYWLDGGAMFGVVPKALWEKKNSPDEKNRIPLQTNCPLIKIQDKWVLLDTGCGTKFEKKEQDIYKIDPDFNIETSLKKFGLTSADIDYVILTHLHFDHVGGGTIKDAEGKIQPTFSNARYCIQKGEWETAIQNQGVMRRTYLEENLIPLEKANLIEWLDGDQEILPGLSVIQTGGHTEHHQVVKIESQGKTALFLGDLVPTVSHLSDSWIMAYDLFPFETLKMKKELLNKIVQEKWLILWDHDLETPAGYLKEENGKIKVESVKID